MGCDVEERTQPRSILCEAKKRRQVEEDATRLRNRILQLERQADKADKRIWHTKQRAKDVLDQRERNERRERERQRLLAQLQQEVQQHRTDITRVKDESRRTRLENEARVFACKLALVQETRTEKREIERILVDQRLLDRRAALERKAEVRASLAQCGSARAQEAERKRALATETYAARVEAEVRAREATEARLAAMARKELDLIDRLRDREAEQQKAYAQLQAALNLGREVSPCTAYVCGDGAEGALSEWRVRDAFHSHAGDDGALAAERVGSALRGLGIELDKAQVDAAVRQLDPDGSGVVHLGDFVTWVRG